MKTMLTIKISSQKRIGFQDYLVRGVVSAAAALTLLGATSRAFAAPPILIAPPIQTGVAPDTDGIADDSQSSIFQWTEVPQNQKVPLTRAVFDQNGYQLFDTAGETVLVPFTANNLYVMKFAPSDDGTLYLVNEGDVPVLYVPQGGYLENADVAGARWYPFPENFHPAHPVFLGVAPNWDAFVSFGWSPGLVIRGGYFGDRSFIRGGLFLPSAGLTFEIGGNHYSDWDSYHSYAVSQPNRFHYDDAGHAAIRPRVFQGAGNTYVQHSSDYAYRAADHSTHGSHVFRGARGDHQNDHRDDRQNR
jgi:hypothetical protein